MLKRIFTSYRRTVKALTWATPLSLLSFRVWVAMDFWNAGLVKISDMQSTISLFETTYHVPLLPPVAAAYTGTAVELILPWFLGLGLGGRMTAAVLFVYNIIAVISYPDLWPDGLLKDFWNGGFLDHKTWGLMLFAVVLFGPGKLSLDYLLERLIWPRFGYQKAG